jgi:hypothetical protein
LVASCNYRGLRIAVHDFKQRINRKKLDIECQRASPKQWSKYAISSVVIKATRSQKPSVLYDFITETLYTERRHPHLGRFYDNSKGKVGRQKLGNNLEFFNAIKSDWLGLELGHDAIKRTFFYYLTSTKQS